MLCSILCSIDFRGIVMYDRLTKKDIEKMQEEIEHRKLVVRKEALEDVRQILENALPYFKFPRTSLSRN